MSYHTWTDPKTKVRYTAIDKPTPRLEVAGQVVSWDSPVIRELFRQVERADGYERLAESCSDAASKHLARIGMLEKEPREAQEVVRSGWIDPETTARYLKALATLKSVSLSCRLQELESEVAIIKSRLEKETT